MLVALCGECLLVLQVTVFNDDAGDEPVQACSVHPIER
jgi:hypothetical protein